MNEQRNPDLLPAHLKELWLERIAICADNGRVSQERAEEIAWEQVKREMAHIKS